MSAALIPPAFMRGRGRIGLVVAVAAVTVLSACGLPGDGSARTVDDGEVPYGLLESRSPSSATSAPGNGPARVPVVVWVSDDRLLPEPTMRSCAEDPDVLVEELLNALAAGPSAVARAMGRSTQLAPGFGLDLVDIVGATAHVDIRPETSMSAERLPAVVGQIVLTATSAPTVRSVVLVTDGARIQVPRPDGILTGGPVTAEDYVDLLPDRFKEPGSFGCPVP